MKYSFCGSEDNKVTDTRPSKDGRSGNLIMQKTEIALAVILSLLILITIFRK